MFCRARRYGWWILGVSFSLLLGLAAAGPAGAQRGGMTVQTNLEEMVKESGYIVRGFIQEVRVERMPNFENIRTVVVTLRVEEALKGDPGRTYTFRQFIWDPRDELDGAGYTPGDHVLLFLITPNRHGLSSPSGLQQGRFSVSQNAAGEWVAVNGANNSMLMSGLRMNQVRRRKGVTSPDANLSNLVTTHRSGPVKLNDLRKLIQNLQGGN